MARSHSPARIRSTSRDKIRSRLAGRASSHSQTRYTRHPALLNAWWLLLSRNRLASIFVAQKPLLVPGIRPFWQRWPCQKHPSTKTTTPYFGRTRSGRPGRSLAWSRYRSPDACRNDRTSSSGLVSLLLIRDIRSLRSDGLRVSVTFGDSFGMPEVGGCARPSPGGHSRRLSGGPAHCPGRGKQGRLRLGQAGLRTFGASCELEERCQLHGQRLASLGWCPVAYVVGNPRLARPRPVKRVRRLTGCCQAKPRRTRKFGLLPCATLPASSSRRLCSSLSHWSGSSTFAASIDGEAARSFGEWTPPDPLPGKPPQVSLQFLDLPARSPAEVDWAEYMPGVR